MSNETESAVQETEEQMSNRITKEEAVNKARKEDITGAFVNAIKGLRRNKQRGDLADDPRVRYPE